MTIDLTIPHQVIEGDCLEVLKSLPTGCVDAVVTDPPYGVGLTAKQHKWFEAKGTGYAAAFKDDREYVRSLVLPCIEECRRISGCVIVTPGAMCLWEYPEPDGWGVIFNKSGTGIGPWGFQCAHPVIYYGKCPYTAAGLGNRPSSWEQPANDYADKCGHPCPKPIGMATWLVERGSLRDQTILDPFCGSGTTGVACVQTGRRFIGIEIEPKYVKIARRRIADAAPLFVRAKEPEPSFGFEKP